MNKHSEGRKDSVARVAAWNDDLDPVQPYREWHSGDDDPGEVTR